MFNVNSSKKPEAASSGWLNPPAPSEARWAGLEAAESKLMELFRGMVDHNGHSELRVEVKPLKKGRKNVVMSSGKDYHFVLKPVQPPVGEDNPVTRSSSKASYGEVIPQGGK
jgi:hypothetical protein